MPQRRARPRVQPADLLAFAAVARAGGVRSGAAALDVPRSTVSRQLAALERAVGGRLVARSTRRFALTELGAQLVDHAAQLEDVLAGVERAAARAATEPAGTLRVAASPVVGEELLPGAIAAYLARFPRVRVEVRLAAEFVDLRRAGIDVAIRTGPIANAADLYATRLAGSLKGHYASRAYLARRGTPQAPAELAVHDCIVIGARPNATWSFRDDVEVAVSGALVVDSYRLALAAAAAGVGIARLPSLYAASLVAAGELVAVLERAWSRTTLYAVHAAGVPAPPKIRAFVELVRDALRSLT